MKRLQFAVLVIATIAALWNGTKPAAAQAIPTVKNVYNPEALNVYVEYTGIQHVNDSGWGGVIGVSKQRWKYIGWDGRGEALILGGKFHADYAMAGVRFAYPFWRVQPYIEPAIGIDHMGGVNGVFGNGFAYRGDIGTTINIAGRLGAMAEYYHTRVRGKYVGGEPGHTGVRQYAFGLTYSF